MYKIIAVALFAALLLAGIALPRETPTNRDAQAPQPQTTTAPTNRDVQEPQPQVTTVPTLTEAEALAIALDHAGLTEADVTRLRAHLDRDDRILHWEVQWRVGNWEYDYDIHAETGVILDWEKDWDD